MVCGAPRSPLPEPPHQTCIDSLRLCPRMPQRPSRGSWLASLRLNRASTRRQAVLLHRTSAEPAWLESGVVLHCGLLFVHTQWLQGACLSRSDDIKCLYSALLSRAADIKCLHSSDGEVVCDSGDTNCLQVRSCLGLAIACNHSAMLAERHALAS